LDSAKLTQVEQDALQKYAEATRRYACDGCDHLCGPAVDAPVQIGATLRYLMYHDVYGDPAGARELFAQLPPEARDLAAVDFSGADRACPNGLDVSGHMRRAAQVLAGPGGPVG
jgi:predicted aldo/keto reductase-like oxidoreductase